MNRSLILILSIMLFSGINVFAQTAPTTPERYLRKRLISKFEVTAGGGILKSTTYYSNTATRFGYSFGGGVAHAFSKTLELKVRVLYEKKGSRTISSATYIKDNQISHTTRDVTTNLNYLTISVMPTIHILPKKNLVFGVGAFYGLLKKAEVIAVITDLNNPAQQN